MMVPFKVYSITLEQEQVEMLEANYNEQGHCERFNLSRELRMLIFDENRIFEKNKNATKRVAKLESNV